VTAVTALLGGSVANMTTLPQQGQRQRWLVSEDPAGLHPVRSGIAVTTASAWTTGLLAGLEALLNGTINDLAIAVDDELPTFSTAPDETATDFTSHQRSGISTPGMRPTKSPNALTGWGVAAPGEPAGY